MAANGTNGYRLTILKNDTAFIKYKYYLQLIEMEKIMCDNG